MMFIYVDIYGSWRIDFSSHSFDEPYHAKNRDMYYFNAIILKSSYVFKNIIELQDILEFSCIWKI